MIFFSILQQPKEFHDSLRHIIDVERQVSDIFGKLVILSKDL
jgi:hypothetical protein